MRLRVIGRSSPYAGPGDATVGYVIEGEDGHFLLECGTGVVAKYLEHYSLADLKGIVVSHLHPDHSADLFPLGFAVKHAVMQGLRQNRVPLFLPSGGVDTFSVALKAFGDLGAHYSEVFAYEEYDDKSRVAIGGWSIHFPKVYHGMNGHGVVIEGEQGERLGYTGDTKMGGNLASFFQGNDLLLCEATVETAEQGEATGHLTAEQAGELATVAQVSQLVLTHFLPGTDVEEKQRLAAMHFPGSIATAEVGKVYSIRAQ